VRFEGLAAAFWSLLLDVSEGEVWQLLAVSGLRPSAVCCFGVAKGGWKLLQATYKLL
jgi:hypothetical protein